jgi:hypothetical protein
MISERFSIVFETAGDDESGKLLPAGWELQYEVDGETWCVDMVFRRHRDALLALAAFERNGITPAIFHLADLGNQFERMAVEALQW